MKSTYKIMDNRDLVEELMHQTIKTANSKSNSLRELDLVRLREEVLRRMGGYDLPCVYVPHHGYLSDKIMVQTVMCAEGKTYVLTYTCPEGNKDNEFEVTYLPSGKIVGKGAKKHEWRILDALTIYKEKHENDTWRLI